ncbi:MAG: hypothetical protein WC335_04965 [Candidatus Omnitrophota bacterium]
MRKIISIAAVVVLAGWVVMCPAWAAEVRVVPEGKGWVLQVDGKPFYVKGAGCGFAVGRNGEDFLKIARDLGANCVRTWGDTRNPDHVGAARAVVRGGFACRGAAMQVSMVCDGYRGDEYRGRYPVFCAGDRRYAKVLPGVGFEAG